MANILRLQEHLSKRPIAPVFKNLKEHEKSDEIAQKFMCIVDYELNKNDLYARLNQTNSPKLLHELLGFHSYKSFTYYEYVSGSFLEGKFLQCKFDQCEFIGPYLLTLTHMAINHNTDVGSTICEYCNDQDLREHFLEDTFDECYQNYLDNKHISDGVIEENTVHQIILDFYNMLKECSKKLEVYTKRKLCRCNDAYSDKSEQFAQRYGEDDARRLIEHCPRRAVKSFSMTRFDNEFKQALVTFSSCDASRFNAVSSQATHKILRNKFFLVIKSVKIVNLINVIVCFFHANSLQVRLKRKLSRDLI